MDETFSPKEIKDVSEATTLAEHGNGSRLRDLVFDDKDFAHHTKIIKEMLNLNQQHLQTLELKIAAGEEPTERIGRLKLRESQKQINGEKFIVRSLSSDGRSIYSEVWNSSKKVYEDTGSCPVPSGFVPPFIRTDK